MFLSGNLFPEHFARADGSIFRNHVIAKRVLSRGSVRVPRRRFFDLPAYRSNPDFYLRSIASELGLPFYIKPTEKSNLSRLIKIHTFKELKHWAETVSQTVSHFENELNYKPIYEMDEFISGDLFTAIAILEGGRVEHFGVHRLLYPCDEFMSGERPLGGVTLPSHAKEVRELEELTRIILRESAAETGVFHVDFLRDRDGFILINVFDSPPDRNIPDIHTEHTGINLENLRSRLQGGQHYEQTAKGGSYIAWFWPDHSFVKQLFQNLAPNKLSSSYRYLWPDSPPSTPAGLTESSTKLLIWNQNWEQLQNDLRYLEAVYHSCED